MNQVLMTAILITMAIVIAGALWALGAGMIPTSKAPVAQFAIEDHPDPISNANAKVFIIKCLGGEKVPKKDVILSVYDESKTLLYSKDLTQAVNDGDVVVKDITSAGYSDKYIEGGEQIIGVNKTALGITSAGTYEIALIYKPTGQPIVDKMVAIT